MHSVPSALHQQLENGHLLLGWKRQSFVQPFGFSTSPVPSAATTAPLFAPPEAHLITIAPTGAGKGRSAIIPTLLTYPGQVVVIDPKAEALTVTGRWRETYGPVVTLNPFGELDDHSDCFNPLDVWPGTDQHIEEGARDLTDALFTGYGRSLKDPFWDDQAEGACTGGLAHILAHEPSEKRHLGRLYELFVGDDPVYRWAAILDTTKQMNRLAYREISSLLSTAELTRSGIISTLQRTLRILSFPEVQETLHTTSFNLDAFARGDPMTLYLVLPPAKMHGFGPLLRIWISTLLNLIMSRRVTPPAVPTLFIVDEAAQLGTMNTLRTAMTLMRYKGIRTWTFWQDLAQMQALYKDWPTLLNNAGVLQTFGVTTYAMAEALASRMHKRKLTPDYLLELPRDEQITLTPGGHVAVSRKPDYLNDTLNAGRFDPNPYYPSHGKERI